MALFNSPDDTTIFLSRSDSTEPLSSYSPHGFELEGQYWPTLEHYYQAMKFSDPGYQQEIRLCETPARANELGHARKPKRQKDWKKNRVVMMVRGMYTKCRTFEEIGEQLLRTGTNQIMENSQYDYFWGCGRDRLGHNNYGKVLMNIRAKLNEEKMAR
ncbi:MAG: NADAR family protein [Gammaproteobacteria bacterium]